jgi:hypothetical protein
MVALAAYVIEPAVDDTGRRDIRARNSDTPAGPALGILRSALAGHSALAGWLGSELWKQFEKSSSLTLHCGGGLGGAQALVERGRSCLNVVAAG